jgi:hypothetical protein
MRDSITLALCVLRIHQGYASLKRTSLAIIPECQLASFHCFDSGRDFYPKRLIRNSLTLPSGHTARRFGHAITDPLPGTPFHNYS